MGDGQGGDLEVGYLALSDSGHAMRQSDDLVRSYTVGKCMMACKFDPDARVPSHELTNQLA
jgi:hypothetical protein